MQQSLTTVLRVPQAQSVVPSLRSGHYNQGPSGTLNTVVPSEAAPNYYIIIVDRLQLIDLTNLFFDKINEDQNLEIMYSKAKCTIN